MSYAKKSIKEYFFVAICSVAMGIILITIGGIFANIKLDGFWGSISKALIRIVFSGWLSIVLLPILSWYTIYKKDVKLGDYISKLYGGTIVCIVWGIIFVIIGTILEGFEWREGFLALIITIFNIIGHTFNLTGYILFLFSPIISWYFFQSDNQMWR